jgi:hypothetical protein
LSFLAYLETSAFSQWVLVSMLGFPTLIALHSVGMAIAVGLTLIISLHLNQLFIRFDAKLLPLFLAVAISGFVLNFFTGLALFVSRGTEYVDSGIFLLKMLLVAVSATTLFWLRQRFEPQALATENFVAMPVERRLSCLATLTWFGAVITGRLIAYLSDIY